MKTGKLYIIGNGFDLYHGLKTKYSDFREYLERKRDYFELLNLLNNHFPDNLWSEFENNLSKLDSDSVADEHYELLPDEDSDRTMDRHIFPDAIEGVKENLTTILKNALRDWILNLDYDLEVELLNLDKNSKYLTFNYSDTLERLYGINRNQITYLHNKAQYSSPRLKWREFDYSDIIVGHADRDITKRQNAKKFIGFKTDYAIEEGNEILNSYYEQSLKKTEEIIAENTSFFNKLCDIEEIEIIGHSLSNIDMPYFVKIKEKAINVKKWIITYHGDENFAEIERQSQIFLKNLENVEFVNTNE